MPKKTLRRHERENKRRTHTGTGEAPASLPPVFDSPFLTCREQAKTCAQCVSSQDFNPAASCMSATTSEPWNQPSACRERGESYYFLADYHAMSTVHDAEAPGKTAKPGDGLAVGLTLEMRSSCQSSVPEVNELAWILHRLPGGPAGTLPLLQGQISPRGSPPATPSSPTPVLMAADILMYDLTWCP